MKKLSFLLILGTLFSCNKKGDKNLIERRYEPYIISVEDSICAEELKKDDVKAPYIPVGI